MISAPLTRMTPAFSCSRARTECCPPFRRTSAKARASLEKLRVTTQTGVFVTSVDNSGVTVKTPTGDERIAARTVLWAAGVKPSPFGEILERRALASRDKRGQVIVNNDCTVPGHPEIFVIGDL